MENFQQVISDLDPTSRVSPQQLETMRELAENFFQTMPALSSVQLYTNPLMVDVTPPQSPSDKCVVLTELLRTLNPDEDPDVICEIAGLIGCDFSRQEMRQLLHNRQANKTKDGYDISPEAVINKMRKTLGAKLVQFTTAKLTYDRTAPTKPEASKTGKPTLETKTAPPPSVTEAEFAQQTRQMEQHRLEKELQKTRRREEFAFEQKKEIARIQGAQQTAASTQDFSMLGLSEKDLARVKDIYKGKVQNAKNFATFAMGLLRKKVAAMGASAKTHTKGSHPKIHFKRKDGESSGGVTFSIHHGGDKHGSLPVQKDTLTRILAI
jgi:hypothetical protein